MSLLEILNEQKLKETLGSEAAKEVEEEEEKKKEEAAKPAPAVDDPLAPIKLRIQNEAVQAMNDAPNNKADSVDRNKFVNDTVQACIAKADLPLTESEKKTVAQSVVSEIIGLGPLDALIRDENISEIMVNGPSQIYVEEHGKLHLTNVKFRDNAHVMTILDRIVAPLGRHIDESSPMVDARLADGSRVNAIIPPLALNGPTITIRKFPKDSISASDLIAWKSASPRMMMFLEACVKSKLNIIVSGGTGSGKCLVKDTIIDTLNDNGQFAQKRLDEIQVGNLVISRDGKPTKVTGVYPQGKREIWEIVTKDGNIAECSADHQWTVAKESHGAIVETVMTTQEMYDKGVIRVKHQKDGDHHQAKYWIPRVLPIESADQTLPVNPYILGYLIGNGSLTSSPICFSTIDDFVVDKIRQTLPNIAIVNYGGRIQYTIKSPALKQQLASMNLLDYAHNKFIPQMYLHGSKQQRLDLLNGLMDSDGTCTKNGTASYCTVSKQLAEDVRDLAVTLGFSVNITKDIRDGKYQNSDCAYNVFLTGGHINPFSLPRKAERFDDNYGRKHETHTPQSYHENPEDGKSYLAGFLFQAKIINGVPSVPEDRLDGELMERLIRYFPDLWFTKDNLNQWVFHLPKGNGRHNGITTLTEEFGYAGVPVMKRVLPDPKYINTSFVRGLADAYGHVHGGDVVFTPADDVQPEIAKALFAIGIRCVRQKGELVVHEYPSTLVHQSEKVRLLREWEDGLSGSYTFRNDYIPIVEIRKTDRQEEMICLKVEDDSHTFVLANGMVTHNTTLLNILSAYIPDTERIVTIEDAAELRLQQNHVVRLEARPANTEGKGRIAIKDLVVNALRMRPDRIIVGECRGGEALDMLQAMNTGHDGSLTTGHANSPRDMMGRLETMVMMSGMELPSKAIREQIASAINIVVQQSRLPDGSRKITSISEIIGMEKDEIVMQEIFSFVQTGVDENGHIMGRFTATGVRPMCIDKLKRSGILVTDDWFTKD